MTLLGKIFIVLIFAMSLVFMAFGVTVYATSQNWRDVVKRPEAQGSDKPLGLEFQKKALQEKLTAAKAELAESKNQLAMEKAARTHAVAALQTRNRQLEQQLTAKEAEFAQLNQAHIQTVALAKTVQDNIISVASFNKNLRSKNLAVIQGRDALLQRVVEMTDVIHELRATCRRLAERNKQVSRALASYQALAERNHLQLHKAAANPPVALRGEILRVSKYGFVEISLGSDDGIAAGHVFTVSRNGTYLGEVIVRKVRADRAVAQINGETKTGAMKKGDHVLAKVKKAR